MIGKCQLLLIRRTVIALIWLNFTNYNIVDECQKYGHCPDSSAVKPTVNVNRYLHGLGLNPMSDDCALTFNSRRRKTLVAF